MKRDVGMACQKVTQTRKGGYKSEGKYTKPYPSLHLSLVYGSTQYVGMTPQKMAATLKVHKRHDRNVCVKLVNSLCEPYQSLSSASMSNRTVNFAGKYH